jgi:hypothetical protein
VSAFPWFLFIYCYFILFFFIFFHSTGVRRLGASDDLWQRINREKIKRFAYPYCVASEMANACPGNARSLYDVLLDGDDVEMIAYVLKRYRITRWENIVRDSIRECVGLNNRFARGTLPTNGCRYFRLPDRWYTRSSSFMLMRFRKCSMTLNSVCTSRSSRTNANECRLSKNFFFCRETNDCERFCRLRCQAYIFLNM